MQVEFLYSEHACRVHGDHWSLFWGMSWDENTEASVHTAARNLAKFIRETLSRCGRPWGLAQHILHETCLREMFRTFRWIWFGTILRSSNEYVCFKSLDFQEVDLLSIFPQGSMNVSSPTACLKKCLPVAQLQQSSCASQLKSYLYKDFFVASPYLTKRFCWVHGFWGVRTSKELTGSFSSVCQNYAGKKVLNKTDVALRFKSGLVSGSTSWES